MSIVVYTSPSCTSCKFLEIYLKEHNLEFVEKDITNPEIDKEVSRKTDEVDLPVVDINGTIISGFKIKEIEKALGKGVS